MSDTLLKKLLLVEQASLAAGPAIRSVEDGRKTLSILEAFARDVGAAAEALRTQIAERAADKLGYDEAIEAYVDEAENLGIERDDAIALIDKRLAVISALPGGAPSLASGVFTVSIAVPVAALSFLALPEEHKATSAPATEPRRTPRPQSTTKDTVKPEPAAVADKNDAEAGASQPVSIPVEAPVADPAPEASVPAVDTSEPAVAADVETDRSSETENSGLPAAASSEAAEDPAVEATVEPTNIISREIADEPATAESADVSDPAPASKDEAVLDAGSHDAPGETETAAGNVVPLPAAPSMPAAPPSRRSRLPAFLAKPGS